jgi:hypothetical protein
LPLPQTVLCPLSSRQCRRFRAVPYILARNNSIMCTLIRSPSFDLMCFIALLQQG